MTVRDARLDKQTQALDPGLAARKDALLTFDPPTRDEQVHGASVAWCYRRNEDDARTLIAALFQPMRPGKRKRLTGAAS